MFSVQLDTTQDSTYNNQCTVILRYVSDAIHERLFPLQTYPFLYKFYFGPTLFPMNCILASLLSISILLWS